MIVPIAVVAVAAAWVAVAAAAGGSGSGGGDGGGRKDGEEAKRGRLGAGKALNKAVYDTTPTKT